jgi:hypothetical protein
MEKSIFQDTPSRNFTISRAVRSRGDLSDFCREAATQYSPGLQSWVMPRMKSDLKVAARRVFRLFGCCSTTAANDGCHLQGTFH